MAFNLNQNGLKLKEFKEIVIFLYRLNSMMKKLITFYSSLDLQLSDTKIFG